MSEPRLAIVVPCYNEESALPHSAPRIIEVLKDMVAGGLVSSDSYVLFVDDGSRDGTWEFLKELKKEQGERVRAIKLSRNFGHQSALICGLLESEYDIAVTIDADLQDPPEVIPRMVEKYREGYEVVYGVRRDRKVDSPLKRLSAELFYWLMDRLGTRVIKNHADFRLLSRRVREVLKDMGEVNLFLRGMIPYIGFPSAVVEYERAKRVAGKTKYPFRKMISFAWEGITSFSTVPLRIITITGFIIFIASLIMSIWAVAVKLTGRSIAGWLSVVLPMYIIGGLNLFFIGIIGEYVGKIYLETKRRPRYIVEERI
jgi:glycosyltransferase involved in cell wall biosynthesis